MSKEIQINHDPGLTDLYFVRYNSAGQVALSNGSAFEDWGTDGRDADDYDVTLTEVGAGGRYAGDFDAAGNIAAGLYHVVAFQKIGANPANGDTLIGETRQQPFVWDGTAEVFLTDQIDALPDAGSGSVAVNHNTGGSDNLAYKTAGGIGIDNAEVRAYLKTDYDAGNTGAAYVKGMALTNVDGRWEKDMQLDPATYTFYFFKQGYYGPDVKEQVVS